ncbi:MAG: GGDEF domain-containing protein [Deltaproteobacteria bacterium]|nr:GGDEF domain-containing protein [Deltaproteobacteria bacterium]
MDPKSEQTQAAAVLAALAEGGGGVVVATLAGELLFATRDARRILGIQPAEVLWGRSPGLLGSAGSEAAFALVSYLVEGAPDDDDAPDLAGETGGFAPLPRGDADTGGYAPTISPNGASFVETGRFAPLPDEWTRSAGELRDAGVGDGFEALGWEPATLPPGSEALVVAAEVPLGPDPDAPRLTGTRHSTGDGDVLVFRLLPPAPSVAPRSTNRAALRERLDRELALRATDPYRRPFVVTLEISNHALVHDSLGPSAAEALMFRIEHRLAEALDEVDRLARLDGPVFAVILDASGKDNEAAQVEANQLAAAISTPVRLGDRTVQPVVKVGFAIARERHVTADDILRDAAIARRRSNAFRTRPATAFVASMHSESRARLDLESALPGAAQRGELELHYQPVIDLSTDRLWGFEALLRWRRPSGLLMPSQFVGVAEETGDIKALGLWVLQAGISQLASWRSGRQAPIRIALNISPRQLGARGLAPRIEALLRHFDLPGDLLEVEVTESLLIEAPDQAARTITALRSLGVRVALDDFGTGYASIEQLHRLPFDVLKADRYFVRRLPGRDADLRIMQTIRTLAQHLDLELVAEGVETEAQAKIMRELGCHRGQGYLYGRPMVASDASRLILTDPTFPLVRGK